MSAGVDDSGAAALAVVLQHLRLRVGNGAGPYAIAQSQPELNFMGNIDTPMTADTGGLAEQLDLSTRRFKLYLAQNVALARQQAGLTQLQLARAAELSRATVHLVEAGICDPRLSTIARLAEALHVNAIELLTQKNNTLNNQFGR